MPPDSSWPTGSDVVAQDLPPSDVVTNISPLPDWPPPTAMQLIEEAQST
jgi:hypothetical protein